MIVKEIMTTDPVVIDISDATISDAMDKMRGVDVHQIPAVNGKTYMGMLNYREIMRRRSLQLTARADNYVVSSPSLELGDDVGKVIRLLVDTGLSAFPVLVKGKLQGIVSRSDIIRNLEVLLGTRTIRNRQIMSTEPLFVNEEDNVNDAAGKMRGLDEMEIPVVDREGKLTGILRLDDIAADTFKRQKQSIRGQEMAAGDRVGEMIKVEVSSSSLMDNPAWVNPEDSIVKTAEILTDRRLHIVPVVNEGMQIEGVVGISDIIDALDTEREKAGMLMVVSGLEPEERDLYDITFAMTSKFLIRFSKITGLNRGRINIHVARYHTEGKTKYSVRTKIIAEPLTMTLDHHDWNYGKCLSFIFETYEPRLRRWKTKFGHPLI